MVAGEFEVDLSAGTITINSGEALSKILNSYAKKAEELGEDTYLVSYSKEILFEIKVEKYRSVSDVRDLTSEQVNKIATAQAIEAAIFEYNYQFNLATQTQMGFHEIVYTAIVTAVSTALTIGVAAGVGSILKYLSISSKTISSRMLGRLADYVVGSAKSFTAASLIHAVVKEMGQELLIDPWIEATVSGLVRRAGGNAMMQMILSSIAESGREAISGPLTSLFRSDSSKGPSLSERLDSKYFSKGLKPTLQQFLAEFNDYQSDFASQQEEQARQTALLRGASRVLSFVSLATGFAASFLLGPVATLMYSTLATYCLTEGISLKNVFRKAFNPVKVAGRKVGSIVRSNKWKLIGTLAIATVGAIGISVLSTFAASPLASVVGNILLSGTSDIVVPTIAVIGLSMYGMVKYKRIRVWDIEDSIKLKENRIKKEKESLRDIKRTLAKLYYEIGYEVEKYSYLAGIAINPTGVTAALLEDVSARAGKKSLEDILKFHSKTERIYKQIQIKLEEKIEFSHWTVIKDKFEKAISLKRSLTHLNHLTGKSGFPRDTFSKRVSKLPSERTDLMVDLFDIALEYIFTSRQQLRDKYAQVFSDIIFGNSWYLTHGFLYDNEIIGGKLHPITLFMILFNIFRLDTTRLRNKVGSIRKFTKSDLDEFKFKCYSRIKKFFFSNPSYVADYEYSQNPQNFELEFDLLWSVWYAYVEWYANKNPDIIKDMFKQDSLFRKMFSDSYFFEGFTGLSIRLFKNLQLGNFIAKSHVSLMGKKLTQMLKNKGKSTFPNQHAIKNALDKVEEYLQVRRIKKKGEEAPPIFFINKALKLSKGTSLPKIYRDHLTREIILDGSFPFSTVNYKNLHPNDYQRCSNFEIEVGSLAADYSQFIQDRLVSRFSDIKNDKILVVDSLNGKNSPKPILDLLKLVKSFSGFDPKNFKNPSHPAIIGTAQAKLLDYVLATELPLWRKVGAKLVTGHVDVVLLIGDTLFVCDYKPGDISNPKTTRFSDSFIMSLPQVAAYSKLHRSQYGIRKIYCVTFNEKGQAWIYQDNILDSLESLLISKGYASWLIWKDYIV